MKRRQILSSWSWLLTVSGSRTVKGADGQSAKSLVSKNSTLSEVSEMAHSFGDEFSGGLTPITNPNEGEGCEETHHSEHSSPDVE